MPKWKTWKASWRTWIRSPLSINLHHQRTTNKILHLIVDYLKENQCNLFPCKWRWNYVQNVILFTWRKSPNFILNFPKISLYWMHNSTKFDKKKRWKIFVRRQTLPLLFFDVLVFFYAKMFCKTEIIVLFRREMITKNGIIYMNFFNRCYSFSYY